MDTVKKQAEITDYVKHLFDEEIQITAITEYGISWNDITQGKINIPDHGVRFDLSFDGKVFGKSLNGIIKGTDYLEVRTDGKFMLNICATIITEDGFTIAVKENGISTPDQYGKAQLNLNMEFHASSKEYEWLNKKQAWIVGEVDLTIGKVNVSGYSN